VVCKVRPKPVKNSTTNWEPRVKSFKQNIERRSVTSGYHGGKISGSQQSSWQRRRFALSNDGRKVWATVLFLSVIMRRKVLHVNLFAIFCHICWTTVCWDPETMATKGAWCNDFSSLLWSTVQKQQEHNTVTMINFKQNVIVNASEGGFAAMKSLVIWL